MSRLKKYLSVQSIQALGNTSWLLSEKILSMGFTLLTSVFVARFLGPENFGVLSYFMAVMALVVPFCSLGLNALLTHELVKYPNRALEIMSTALSMRLCACVVISLILVLCIYFSIFSFENSLAISLTFFAVANIFSALQVIDFWFQAKVASKYVAKIRFIVIVLFSLIKLLLVYAKVGVNLFMLVLVIESLAVSLGYFLYYVKKGGRFSFKAVNFQYGNILIKKSKWLILSGVASIVYLKIDQVMLAQLSTSSEVGVYSVASKLSEVWYFFPIALVSSFFPTLIKLKQLSEVKYFAKLQSICDALFISALLLAITISYFSKLLVDFLFGVGYEQSSIILSIHIWAGLFVFMRALLSKWLIAENLLKFSLVTHGLGAVMNIAINWLVIPEYAGVGAAWATLISYAFASYFALFFHQSTLCMAKVMTKSILMPLRLPLHLIKYFKTI